MAGAIARGLRASGDTESTIVLQNPEYDLAAPLADEVDARIATDLPDLLDSVELVILAIKPDVQETVLRDIAPHLTGPNPPALLSIAAGRTLDKIAANLADAPVTPHLLRVMPNVNAQVGASMSGLTASADTPPETVSLARAVFESIGTVIELPEKQFPIFTALAGCSPAWFFQVVDALALAGVKHGLPKGQAEQIATQAMLGSAELLREESRQGENPSGLIGRVCSPGGTTIAGLLAAQKSGLSSSLVDAVDAAVQRDLILGEK